MYNGFELLKPEAVDSIASSSAAAAVVAACTKHQRASTMIYFAVQWDKWKQMKEEIILRAVKMYLFHFSFCALMILFVLLQHFFIK